MQNTFKYMTEQDLIALDTELDSFLPISDLGKVKLDRVISHLLFVNEIGEKTGILQQIDHGAVDIAVGWAFQFCKDSNHRAIDLTYDEKLFALAVELYKKARNYRAISDIMRLLFRGKLAGIRDGATVSTEIISPYDQGMACAETDLFGSSDPLLDLPNTDELVQYYGKCNRRLVGQKKVEYTFSIEFFNYLRGIIHDVSERDWELNSADDIGGYSLKQYRHVLECVKAIGMIHHFCSAAPPSQPMKMKHICFDSLLLKSHRRKWIQRLMELSKLPLEVVELIFHDLSCSKADFLARKKADLMARPFLELTPGTFVLGNRLAYEGNSERNLCKWLSLLKPNLYSKISTSKEALQINRIETMLLAHDSTRSLRTFSNLDVNGKTDIDLLILDDATKFGLVLQLKWPYGPAYLREMESVWTELKKGVEKVEIAVAWLRQIPQVLEQKSGLTRAELTQYRFEPLVLSKNAIGLGWMEYSEQIPICSDRFFKWALVNNSLSLLEFWKLASKYAYKPIEGVHFNKRTIKPKFGSFTFSAPIAFRTIRKFDPVEDIDWK